ncbi:hypothetical protein CL634_02935 [bacterium]|nr:hypothetical protein [bacterium]|tara:strand:+ start:171 stop:533 length:363 start_codon:yes stop_codon:yes gene_type:complete
MATDVSDQKKAAFEILPNMSARQVDERLKQMDCCAAYTGMPRKKVWAKGSAVVCFQVGSKFWVATPTSQDQANILAQIIVSHSTTLPSSNKLECKLHSNGVGGISIVLTNQRKVKIVRVK